MKIPVGLSLLVAACLVSASPASAQTCGDYVRDAGEQCDDGNARNLDGCDAACSFEQTQRVNLLRIVGTTDLICANNRFGGAFNALGLASTNSGINTGVQAGATSVLLHFLRLDDPTGATNDSDLDVGVLSSAPIVPGSVAYNGSNDTDWWHAADKTLIDAQRVPVNKLAGTLTGGALSASGAAQVKLVLGGGPASFSLTDIQLNVTTGASTTPASSTGLPPGHLAVEHLDPTLTSFATAGTSSPASGFGTLCGDISALSLSQTVVPPALRIGPGACTQAYTTSNSLLDVFIGGCTVPLAGQAVAANTQPDQTVPATPPPAGTGPYTFTADATTKIVTKCLDSTLAEVDLPTCLAHLAYSSYFRFTTNRVIAHDNVQFADSFGSGDLSAWSAVSTAGGDLVVDPSASMAGTPAQGLLGTIDDNQGRWVQDSSLDNENRLRARFYIDPSAFDPGELSGFRRTRVLIAFEELPTRRAFVVILRRLAGQYAIRARASLDDNTRAETPFVDITAAPHFIEVDWLRSSGPDANDGRLVLSIDNAVVSTLTGLDNSISSIDFARLGALSLKPAANGTLKWDHYQANRMGAVGP